MDFVQLIKTIRIIKTIRSYIDLPIKKQLSILFFALLSIPILFTGYCIYINIELDKNIQGIINIYLYWINESPVNIAIQFFIISLVYLFIFAAYAFLKNNFIDFDAIIIEYSDQLRDKKFAELNKRVTKTYSAYGIVLNSLSNHNEYIIKKYWENGVKVRLCLANPHIFRDNICLTNYTTGYCQCQKYIDKNSADGTINANLSQKIKDNCDFSATDLLNKYKAVLNTQELADYLSSDDNNYEKTIKQNIKTLCSIMERHKPKGSGSIEVRKINSFIPLSMTIVDENLPSGQLIVEYLLPYTDRRVLLHIKKKNSKIEFECFSNLFNVLFVLGKDIQD